MVDNEFKQPSDSNPEAAMYHAQKVESETGGGFEIRFITDGRRIVPTAVITQVLDTSYNPFEGTRRTELAIEYAPLDDDNKPRTIEPPVKSYVITGINQVKDRSSE
jgi:hypothetical protein